MNPNALPLARFRALLDGRPDAPMFTWVDAQGRDRRTLRARELAAAAEAVAAHLRGKAGLVAGDRVLLVYPPGLDFVVGLLGCMLAGVVAVPVAPPHPLKLKQDLAAFGAIAADAGASAVLTNREYEVARHVGGFKAFVQGGGARWPDLPWHTTDGLRPGKPVAWHAAEAHDVALLQYTSGSTGSPKGVRLTHGNLASETAANAADLGLGPDARAVLWLPGFHAFCLVNGLVNGLVGHGHLYLMSPLDFVARPALWFDVMSRVGATHTAAANFALELALKQTTPDERARWDLGRLAGMVCGAEPVREATLQAFYAAFAPAGLRPGVIRPAYGLSEHTVGVTTGRDRRLTLDPVALSEGRAVPAEAGTRLVGNGRVTKAGTVVHIVDPETRRVLAPGQVGEIWVDGPSKAAGYHGRPEASADTFEARLADDDGRRYLRTGDLGFVWDGELYPTGRLKELIIVRGKNHHPHDLEDSLQGCHPRLRPTGALAAFAVTDAASGTEGVAIAAELAEGATSEAEARGVAEAVRTALMRHHQLACTHVVVVAAGALPRTPSGKIRRRVCQEGFERGTLQAAPDTRLALSFGAPPAPVPAPAPARDTRLDDLSPAYAQLIGQLGRQFVAMTRAKRGRVVHTRGTTLLGRLEVLASDAPRHALLAPGASLPVFVRHANGVQEDDAGGDNRGATVRVLHPDAPEALDRPFWDLLLTTGQCFVQRSAEGFARWMAGPAERREAWVAAEPHLGEAAWDMWRRPDSFATVYYYSKTAGHYVAADGTRHYARYRLVPAAKTPDTGFLDPAGRPLPPDVMAREPGDTRAATFLHDELRDRLGREGVAYVLQLQLRPADAGDEDAVLDCTRPWPEADWPWRDWARLTFDRLLDDAATADLAFNPRHAPSELGLIHAREAGASASLNHVRSLVYDMAACARRGTPMPPALQALIDRAGQAPQAAPPPVPAGPRPLRVCVIGAGVSGLTTARELEKQGHHVTVLERASEVGGKCGSVSLGDRWYDLGGHVCTANYVTLARMVDELGLGTMPVTPGKPFDALTGTAVALDDPAAMGRQWLRYVQARDRDFPALKSAGLAAVARTLQAPVGRWLAEQDLEGFARLSALMYTASGYGYLQDPELPALYFLKFAEMLVGAPLNSPLPPAWTIEGGFLKLWKAVADGLRDVRLGVDVRAVERSAEGVRVHLADETLAFDKLVVATPLHAVPPFLTPSDEERAVFGKVRHYDYYTTIVEAEGVPEDGFFLLQPYATEPGWHGHAVAVHQRYAGDGVAIAYAYGRPDQDGAAIAEILAGDLARMGGRMGRVHTQVKWPYFPHFSAQDIEDGIYDRLEALQGRQHTYYVGSLFNFELVECNVAYATQLVARHFGTGAPALAAAPPAPAVVPASASGQAALVATIQRALCDELALASPPAPACEFVALGLDSLQAMALLQRLSRDVGQVLTPEDFFAHPTIAELAAHLAVAPAIAPSGMLTRLQALAMRELQLDALPAGDVEFVALGLDSLRAMTLLQQIAAETGVALSPSDFFDHPTFEALAAYMAGMAPAGAGRPAPVPSTAPRPESAREESSGASRWFPRVAPAPRARLFCFHHAGGSPALFAGWPQGLPADVELRAMQLPGRGARAGEPALDQMEALLQALETHVVELLDRPFAFFGHSMGALVAFELARRLRRRGLPQPSRLFLSALASPVEGRQMRHVTREAVVEAGGWLSPEAHADLSLGETGHFVPGAPLDVPFTVLGGRTDPIAPPSTLVDWHRHTTAAFELQLLPGGHFYPMTEQDALVALVAERLAAPEAPAREQTRLVAPPRPVASAPVPLPVIEPDAEGLAALQAHLAEWRARPCAMVGGNHVYHLAWLARAAGRDGQPLFPEALPLLLASQDAEGGVGPASPLPLSDYCAAIAFANSLLRWSGHAEAVERAIAHALALVARMGTPPRLESAQPYGPGFVFDELFGHWIVPVFETERLLATAGPLLGASARATLEALIAPHREGPMRRAFERLDHARLFADNAITVMFGEFFPDAAFLTPEARAHAQAMLGRADGLPGHCVPPAVRYAELTGDPATIARLRALLQRPSDGLYPVARLAEDVIGGYYLWRGGVDLARHCPELVARLAEDVRGPGIGVFDGITRLDCDMSAMALILASATGLRAGFGVELLERFWSAPHAAYLAYGDQPLPNITTEIHVLEAVMTAPDVDEAHRRRVWQRTLRLLETRPWREKFLLSPVYIWETIACALYRYASRFPDDPTEVHHRALELLLAEQGADGGFGSAYVQASNRVETGLALVGLRELLTLLPPGERRERVRLAASRAYAFLETERQAGRTDNGQLTTLKLLGSLTHLENCIVVGAMIGGPIAAPRALSAGRGS